MGPSWFWKVLPPHGLRFPICKVAVAVRLRRDLWGAPSSGQAHFGPPSRRHSFPDSEPLGLICC